MKRSRLKRRSPKHAEANDAAREARDAYRCTHPVCMLCEWRWHENESFEKPRLSTEVHHIAGRDAKRCDVFEVAANWLPICRECHERVTNHAVQTAWQVWEAKLFCDPETADLGLLKRLNPRRFRNVT